MKYEVIETVQTIKKNNGDLFKISKIKWNDNYKYDFRMWRKDVPLQGLVMTENETLAFCRGLAAYIQDGDKTQITPEDYMFGKKMADIDLTLMVNEHPDCLRSLTKLKNLLTDYFPGKDREIFILSLLHEAAVLNRLKSLPEITMKDVRNISVELEDRFGIKRAYSAWGIYTWARALMIPVKQTEYIHLYEREEQLGAEAFYVPCDNIISNSDLQIVYNGAEVNLRTDGWISLHFQAYNRSSSSLVVRFVNAWTNGNDDYCNSEDIIAAKEKKDIKVSVSLSRNSIEKLKEMETNNGRPNRNNRFRVSLDKLGEIKITLMFNRFETDALYTAKEMILALGEKTI